MQFLGAQEGSALMATPISIKPSPNRLARRGLAVAVLALTTVIGGCAQVPDAVNPVEWYKSTIDFFGGGDDTESAADAANKPDQESRPVTERGQPAPGADKPFPSLATVPDRPPAPSATERRQVVEGLVADRSRARYSSEVIRRQGEPATALSSGATAPLGASAPPPPPSAIPMRRDTMPAPVAPPVVAAAPSSVAALPSAATPSSGGSVQEIYRARLAQRLGQSSPANASSPGAAHSFETVVVSSAGVQVGGKAQAVATRPTPALPRVGTVVAAVPDAATGATSLKVATILFRNGSARLSQSDHEILRSVARLHRQKGGRVRIIGHASSRTRTMDPVRHKMVNFKVSADRAQVVSDALMRAGLGRQDIATRGASDSQPLYYEVMPSGEAGNRRTEIYIDR
jgi:flagellar motor protein MotB